jgi:hypothetical protein
VALDQFVPACAGACERQRVYVLLINLMPQKFVF